MLDYNPDREGHVDHKWVVHNAQTDRKESIEVDDKVMKFNREERFLVNDPKLANAIRQKYPREVTVTRLRWPSPHDRGHTYLFGGVALPWHKYDENGRRIIEEEAVKDEG